MSRSRLAIIIVSYNSRQEIGGCLESLAAHPPAAEHEVVVVDNASTDDTRPFVIEQWPGVRLIDAGGNLGFAAGNNAGIRQTSGEMVLLLNPDARVSPGAIDTLAGVLARDRGAAIVGPRLVDAAGRAELSFGSMISPLAELRQKVLVTGSDRGIPVIARLVERMTRQPRQVDWVSGACLLIRRADLEAAGLLDERFFMYTEDVDLCAAVRSRGRRVLFTPEAEVVHLRGRSAASAPAATRTAYRRSQIAFYRKHHPRWVPLLEGYLRLTGEWPDTRHDR